MAKIGEKDNEIGQVSDEELVLAAREEIRGKKMQDVQKELRRAFLRTGLLEKNEK